MADDAKRDRLKAALRENLKRRKSQGRERAEAASTEPVSDGAGRKAEGDPPERGGG